MSPDRLELVLFAHRPETLGRALDAGITSFIVDWEWRGKQPRQTGRDTEINRDSPADLRRLARLGAPRRLCRINRWGPWAPAEVELAVACGATDVLLPMAEAPAEVEALLARLDGRGGAGILIETAAGVARARDLTGFPLSAVYVGLNDLAISRGSGSIFDALADGTVDTLREAAGAIPFGVAGVTVVDRGEPIPCRLLLAELARLDCAFSFLRRSFRRDVDGRDWRLEIERIGELWRHLRARPAAAIELDRAALVDSVAATRPAAPVTCETH